MSNKKSCNDVKEIKIFGIDALDLGIIDVSVKTIAKHEDLIESTITITSYTNSEYDDDKCSFNLFTNPPKSFIEKAFVAFTDMYMGKKLKK